MRRRRGISAPADLLLDQVGLPSRSSLRLGFTAYSMLWGGLEFKEHGG